MSMVDMIAAGPYVDGGYAIAFDRWWVAFDWYLRRNRNPYYTPDYDLSLSGGRWGWSPGIHADPQSS